MLNKIITAIAKEFNPRYYTIQATNFNKCISVQTKTLNKSPGTAIWIRIEQTAIGTCLNISSVCITKRKRRQGVFTRMAKNLAAIPEINSLKIGGVCSDPMRNWCEKNGFEELPSAPFDYILSEQALKDWAKQN